MVVCERTYIRVPLLCATSCLQAPLFCKPLPKCRHCQLPPAPPPHTCMLRGLPSPASCTMPLTTRDPTPLKPLPHTHCRAPHLCLSALRRCMPSASGTSRRPASCTGAPHLGWWSCPSQSGTESPSTSGSRQCMQHCCCSSPTTTPAAAAATATAALVGRRGRPQQQQQWCSLSRHLGATCPAPTSSSSSRLRLRLGW